MQTKPYYYQFLLLALIWLGVSTLASAQIDHFINVERRADVMDGAVATKFHKLPELKSVNGELTVHLYAKEKVYDFIGSKVKLRTYTYESGEHVSEEIGPWSPTLRIGQNDRLNIIVHNELSNEEDRNYLGSMSVNNQELLQSDTVSKELFNVLIDSTTTNGLIKPATLLDATIQVIEAGKKWLIKGTQICLCPPGKEGTCGKKDIYYPIEQMYNYGSQKKVLRIYELVDHDDDHNVPHGFNNTNMHTHGFHVSPFQDDIFRMVLPGDASYYTYKLDNHTPGTMWYHPHIHGSTALQVASGMSGVIIIEDPDLSDFPNLKAASTPEQERVMVFNQIMYEKETGELPDFNTLGRIYSSEKNGFKGTTVNGVTIPKMNMEKGEIQRWRMVHSGYRSTLALYFPEEIEVMQVAVDGIMFNEARTVRSVHLSPGNRTDLLVKVPKNAQQSVYNILSIPYETECEYFVNKDACTAMPKGSNESMMQIIVNGDRTEMKFPTKLPGPVDHPDILDDELENLGNPRKTHFNIDTSATPTEFTINHKPFQTDTIHERLTLGTAEEWHLSSDFASHPYHIHINPFQVTKFKNQVVDPPMWKDVVMVPSASSVMIRSRYTRYWGDFVLHCHLLHHEDQGMMQRIRIQRPKSPPSVLQEKKKE